MLSRLSWSFYLFRQPAGQRKLPFLPLEQIRREQTRRVRRMVDYAYRHVPFYIDAMRRLGLRPEDFKGAGDLARLRRYTMTRRPSFRMPLTAKGGGP